MEIPVVEVQKRESTGSREARRLRAQGLIPAVLYGLGGGCEALSVPVDRMEELVRHGAHLVDLAIGGKTQTALLKDVQFDHLGDVVLHVDFSRVKKGAKIRVMLPLEFEGSAKGAAEGGIVEHLRNDIEVECLPHDLPEKIVIDVSALGLGDHLSVKDLALPAGVVAAEELDTVVATVTFKGGGPEEEVPAEEESLAEPELIRRKEKPEEEAKE